MLQGDPTFFAWSTNLWKMWSRFLRLLMGRILMRGSRATGVTTSVVEAMEESFKRDVLREVRAGGGHVLLHDEVEERPGVFSIIPIWENVNEDDIMTPRDVFELVKKEGYGVRSSFKHLDGLIDRIAD